MQAWSQVGWRLAVASRAKIRRPRGPAGRTAGMAASFLRKASTCPAEEAFSGSFSPMASEVIRRGPLGQWGPDQWASLGAARDGGLVGIDLVCEGDGQPSLRA